MDTKVTVWSTKGKKFTVPYSPRDTLNEVKVKLYDECGIKPERQTWCCLGYHVDCNEVPFEALVAIAREVQPTGDPFVVTFPVLSWKDGSTGKDIDTDREAFAMLMGPFRIVLFEREEWRQLNLKTKFFVLLYPTKRRAQSGTRHYKAEFYGPYKEGLLDVLLQENADLSKKLLCLENGTQEKLKPLEHMELEEIESIFMDKMQIYTEFLAKVGNRLEDRCNTFELDRELFVKVDLERKLQWLDSHFQIDHVIVISTKTSQDSTVWAKYIQAHWSKLIWENSRILVLSGAYSRIKDEMIMSDLNILRKDLDLVHKLNNDNDNAIKRLNVTIDVVDVNNFIYREMLDKNALIGVMKEKSPTVLVLPFGFSNNSEIRTILKNAGVLSLLFLDPHRQMVSPLAPSLQNDMEQRETKTLDESIQTDHLMVITASTEIDAVDWREYVLANWSKLVWRNSRIVVLSGVFGKSTEFLGLGKSDQMLVRDDQDQAQMLMKRKDRDVKRLNVSFDVIDIGSFHDKEKFDEDALIKVIKEKSPTLIILTFCYSNNSELMTILVNAGILSPKFLTHKEKRNPYYMYDFL